MLTNADSDERSASPLSPGTVPRPMRAWEIEVHVYMRCIDSYAYVYMETADSAPTPLRARGATCITNKAPLLR